MLTARERLTTGFRVYSADGHPIGTVARVGFTHFSCESGFLGLGRPLYFPFADVARVDGDCCFLDVGRDHIDAMQFHRVPTGWV